MKKSWDNKDAELNSEDFEVEFFRNLLDDSDGEERKHGGIHEGAKQSSLVGNGFRKTEIRREQKRGQREGKKFLRHGFMVQYYK